MSLQKFWTTSRADSVIRLRKPRARQVKSEDRVDKKAIYKALDKGIDKASTVSGLRVPVA